MASQEECSTSAKVVRTEQKEIHTVSGSTTEGTCEEIALKERFSLLSTIGIQFSLAAAPLAIGSYANVVQGIGGGPFLFWGTLVACVFQTLVCLSVAELASSFPHTLAMSHWAAQLAPVGWERFFSYWTASVTTLQTQCDNAGSWLLTSYTILATVTIFSDLEYERTNWQCYLTICACVAASCVVNLTPRLLGGFAKLTTVMVIIINSGAIFQAVALLVRAHPKPSPTTVFFDVTNETGWSSLGVVFFFAMLPGVGTVGGFNYICHLTEEVPRPGRTIPIVLVSVALLASVTVLLMIIVLLFCIVNPASLNDPIGGMLISQILWDGYSSKVLSGINMLIVAIVFVIGGSGFLTCSSRMFWTFSNHGGLPLSRWIGRINSKTQIPDVAVLCTALICLLICLLQLGPSTVLNAILGFSFLSGGLGYSIPIWLVIIRGRSLLPEDRYFNLGSFGLLINILSALWLLISCIFFAFPSYLPVTADNMNYGAPVFFGLLSLFIPNWFFHGKKNYHVPAPLETAGISHRRNLGCA
ncbi:unnamed protein product [Clonostachys byssicola]|uniref:Uncharacterized protein n=1 Tax=Clonostachys byssicola TaxID=160290 RepID=A0A9N9UDA2_9HYPO|nr:unnamed protein product [Clonostachys byssicola]